MNQLDSLVEFVSVVERGSFSAAARQLSVSVSHVSRQIADLEGRLKTQLFRRTTRRMVLTDAGRRLFDNCQPLVQELLRAQESVLAAQDTVSGDIRISLAGKFAEEQLVPLLMRFAKLHPDVRLDIDMSARNVDLLGEGFQLAVRMGPLQSSSTLVATRLISIPMVLLAAPALLATLAPMMAPSDLPPALCLGLAGRPWEFVKGSERVLVEPCGRIASNSGAAVLRAACDGLGIINVPAYYAPQAPGDLQRLFPDWVCADESVFHLVFPAGRHLPQRVRRLIDFLQMQCPAMRFGPTTS